MLCYDSFNVVHLLAMSLFIPADFEFRNCLLTNFRNDNKAVCCLSLNTAACVTGRQLIDLVYAYLIEIALYRML